MRTTRALEIRRFIGANAWRMRKARGLSQELVAERAEIEKRYLQDIERARANVTIDVLVRLAGVFGVKETDLLEPAELPAAVRGRPPKPGSSDPSKA